MCNQNFWNAHATSTETLLLMQLERKLYWDNKAFWLLCKGLEFLWCLISQFRIPKSVQQQCLVSCVFMSCRVVGAAGQQVAILAWIVVAQPEWALLGPAVFLQIKVGLAWRSAEPSPAVTGRPSPLPLRNWCCKTYLLRYREKAILHLITSIWFWTDRLRSFVGGTKQKTKGYLCLFGC